MLGPGWHQEELDAEDGEEDAQRGELLEVGEGEAAAPRPGDGVLLDLGADHDDHVHQHQEVHDHDEQHGHADQPGRVPEIHPAVLVVVDISEDSVRNDGDGGQPPAQHCQQPQPALVTVESVEQDHLEVGALTRKVFQF